MSQYHPPEIQSAVRLCVSCMLALVKCVGVLSHRSVDI